jgi:flagellin-like hook-associated protein FlgL
VNSNTVSYTVQTTDIGASAAATLANVTNALATAVNANTTLINGTAGVLLSAISDGTDTITFVENGNGTPTILSGTNSQSAISLGNETSTSSTQALKSLAAGTADGDARIKIVSNSATETVDISTTSTTAVTISNAAWGSTFSFTGDDANVVAGDSATVTVTNPTGTGENDAQVVFNTDGTSTITVQAVDTTSSGLSISATANSWAANSDVDAAIAELDAAKTSLRSNSKTMATSLGVIQTRETFTENFIDNLRVGADKLTLADGSEEATNMLMLQTRQQLGIQALSMASQSSQSILSLFR